MKEKYYINEKTHLATEKNFVLHHSLKFNKRGVLIKSKSHLRVSHWDATMFGTEVKFSKTCLSGVFLVHFLHVFSAIFFVIISVDIAVVLERQKIWFWSFLVTPLLYINNPFLTLAPKIVYAFLKSLPKKLFSKCLVDGPLTFIV